MKINIRDLLWLLVVAALLCGWWRESRQAALAAAELEVRTTERDIWKRHADGAKRQLWNKGFRITYYASGVQGMESKEQAAFNDANPHLISLGGPEIRSDD